MLCALEPVKYNSAAPYASGSTARRSTWSPPCSFTVARVSPFEMTSATSPYATNRSIALGLSSEVTAPERWTGRSEEHTSELQSRLHLVCRLLLEKKKKYEKEYDTNSTLLTDRTNTNVYI